MESKKKGFTNFIRRFGYYIVAGFLVVGICVGVALFATTNPQLPNDDNDKPASTVTISFALPMESPALIKSYSDSELFWNATLKQWESHRGVDLTSTDGKVFAVLEGTVKSVNTNYENGTVVVISHAEGYESIYSSLSEDVDVKEGDNVAKGQYLGTANDSSELESADGNHLHFELMKDNTKVNPANYLELEVK